MQLILIIVGDVYHSAERVELPECTKGSSNNYHFSSGEWGAQARLIWSVCLPSQQRCGRWKGLLHLGKHTLWLALWLALALSMPHHWRIHSLWVNPTARGARPQATPLSLYGANFKVKKAPFAVLWLRIWKCNYRYYTRLATPRRRSVAQIWMPRYTASRVTSSHTETLTFVNLSGNMEL